MEAKVTVRRYLERKLEIKEEKWFKNGSRYGTMMRARSNTLPLKWRSWGSEEEKMCPLCNKTIETLEHFLMDCDTLQLCRNKYLELQRPQFPDNREDIIAKILLMKKDEERKDEEYIEMVEEIWRTRKGIIRQNEEQATD